MRKERSKGCPLDQSAYVLAVGQDTGDQQQEVFVVHPNRPVLLIRSFALKKTIRAWRLVFAAGQAQPGEKLSEFDSWPEIYFAFNPSVLEIC